LQAKLTTINAGRGIKRPAGQQINCIKEVIKMNDIELITSHAYKEEEKNAVYTLSMLEPENFIKYNTIDDLRAALIIDANMNDCGSLEEYLDTFFGEFSDNFIIETNDGSYILTLFC
jgi:hypothetical protein